MIWEPALIRAFNESLTMRNNFPRRVAAAAPPGSLLKRHSIQPRNDGKEATGRDAGHLAMVRQCPCLKCGMEPSEAAHVRMASAAFGKTSGMGKKPEDRFALPLCADCHRLARDAQHKRSELSFWGDLGINPLLTAHKLYAQSGDLVAMRHVCMVAIAERGTE